MNNDDTSLRRLMEAARRAPRSPDEPAPFGFSTRVAALAFDGSRPAPANFGRVSLRAAGIACLFAVVAVGVNYSAILGAFDDDSASAADDPVAAVVNLDS